MVEFYICLEWAIGLDIERKPFVVNRNFNPILNANKMYFVCGMCFECFATMANVEKDVWSHIIPQVVSRQQVATACKYGENPPAVDFYNHTFLVDSVIRYAGDVARYITVTSECSTTTFSVHESGDVFIATMSMQDDTTSGSSGITINWSKISVPYYAPIDCNCPKCGTRLQGTTAVAM